VEAVERNQRQCESTNTPTYERMRGHTPRKEGLRAEERRILDCGVRGADACLVAFSGQEKLGSHDLASCNGNRNTCASMTREGKGWGIGGWIGCGGNACGGAARSQ